MKLKALVVMVLATLSVIIEETTNNILTKLLVNKYCEITPEQIEEGLTLMDICGTNYEAYLRIALIFIFLVSAGVFLMNPYSGGMMNFRPDDRRY